MSIAKDTAALIERYAGRDPSAQQVECPHCMREVTVPDWSDVDAPCPECGRRPSEKRTTYDLLGVAWLVCDLGDDCMSRVDGHPDCCRVILPIGAVIDTHIGTVTYDGESVPLSADALEQLEEEALGRIACREEMDAAMEDWRRNHAN